MALPGFFAKIKLGEAVIDDPGTIIDLSNVNFAIVMHDDDAPVPHRFTTWGMQADSATLYQSLTNTNKIIIGDAGYIYALKENVHDDDGVNIPLVIETGPLPEADAESSTTAQHRLHRIMWQLFTKPPVKGHEITVRVTDMDDSTNYKEMTVRQTTTKLLLPITITARQFRIKWKVDVTQDFDIVSFGYAYQTLNRPYWKQQ